MTTMLYSNSNREFDFRCLLIKEHRAVIGRQSEFAADRYWEAVKVTC